MTLESFSPLNTNTCSSTQHISSLWYHSNMGG